MKQFIKRLFYRLQSNFTTDDLVRKGLKVGTNFKRMHGCILDPSHCWLITIGDNVTLAPGVHLLAHDASVCHHLGYARIGRVNIGNNVFIGAGSIVLPHVSIGDNAVIGANSTVTRDIPSNVVAAGNPAKVLSSIEKFIEKNSALLATNPVYGEEYTERKQVSPEKKVKMYRDLSHQCGFIR